MRPVTHPLLVLLALAGIGPWTGCGNDDDDAARGAGGSGASEPGSGGSGAGLTGGGGSGGNGTGGSGSGGAAAGGTSGASGDTLSQRHPGDSGLAADPAVLLYEDFEDGWGKWSYPTADTQYLHLEQDASLAHAGTGYLRSTVTASDLAVEEYISSAAHFTFPTRVGQVFWRFHVRVQGIAPNPHHWFRMSAGTEAFEGSGLANTVPPGDEGFWFDLDANRDDLFNFYVYWHQMRSGRCNDGSTTPGCEGDQGVTYHYGNTFRPLGQSAFPRDSWFCVEIMGTANTLGAHDGQLAFWVDDQLVGDFREGYPDGTWLRDSFHPGGCTFSACTPPVPFEGFDFRTSDDVRFKHIALDAYYERGSFQSKKEELEALGLTVSDEQTIYYDDVVVATERIGCRRAP